VSEYTVSLLPVDDANYGLFALRVRCWMGGVWAVEHHGYVLNRSGGWTYRGKVRFDTAEEAIERARKAYPLLRVNGWRWDGVRFDRTGRKVEDRGEK
jgi:hypothetical protein